ACPTSGRSSCNWANPPDCRREESPRRRLRPEARVEFAGGSSSFLGSRVKARTVRLVACIAGLPAGMLLCVHLRETCRFGDIFRVATDAKLRHIRQNWLNVAWIIGVLRERSVTRLAVDGLMDPLCFQRSDIGVAILAGLVPRKGHRPCT